MVAKGIGFENPSYFCKAKELRHSLYDERVIGLGYTPMFLTHSDEALEIKKFKRARENKIEFAYDYGNMNTSYVNVKINLLDDYSQEIINLDFEKIDSLFQQTSSLKPYVLIVILEKIIIDMEDEVMKKGSSNTSNVDSSSVSHSKMNKDVKLYASCDVNDLFIFDDVCIIKSQVSKMPFRKKPRDPLNVRSKSNSNQSLHRTVFRWLPKMQPLADPIGTQSLLHVFGVLFIANCPDLSLDHRFGMFKEYDGCYLLNDYDDVGKLKEKGDIRVIVGYSKESAAFRVYNKHTRKIHESMNVNFDEISEMASKQFNLEPGLSNLNKTVKSSNSTVSQVLEISKKYLKDLFHNFYDEYFDFSKITKSPTTNVETSNNEIPSHEGEVFHEVFESFQDLH
nr:retrovirus-related Pol polyprotein from transposon TNT 1-94 [Tanacetum cinerariifolium]